MTPPFTDGGAGGRRCARCSRPRCSRRAPTSTTAVADWEAEHLFLGGWVCVGHAQPLAARGAFVTREIGGESLLFMGDDEGRAHGVFNVCRHRGARLVDEPEGTMRRLQCPYHAWCYGFDGALQARPRTRTTIEDFDPAATASRRAHGGRRRPPVRRRLRHAPAARRPRRRPARRTSSATGSASSSARARSPTTSRRTGRRSSRTTPSACTARACTPSSTASATT